MGRNVGAYVNIGIFAAIIAACIFMPTFLRKITSGIFDEFRAPLGTIPSQLRDLETFWISNSNSKRALQEAGRDLARINASNELKLRDYYSLLDRLERYENLFDLPSFPEYRGEIARVTVRDMNAWWQRVRIRKGSSHGITPGCAVIYGGGVVGRVVEVSRYESVVELVSSVNFRMAAHFESDDRPVVYQGEGMLTFQKAAGKVSDVPTDLSVASNQPRRLVTSSLAGTFPEGLTIGIVRELSLDSDELFKDGRVELSANLASLNEVLVLIPLKRDDNM